MKDWHHKTKLSVYLASECELWTVIVKIIVLCQEVYKAYSAENIHYIIFMDEYF